MFPARPVNIESPNQNHLGVFRHYAEAFKVKLNVQEKHLRPGDTVSGPTMFSLADVSIYMVIMAMIGPEPLTVTTGCSMDFMRKPAGGRDIIASSTLLKLGRNLAVGDVLIHSEGISEPVARATMTYAIPQKAKT